MILTSPEHRTSLSTSARHRRSGRPAPSLLRRLRHAIARVRPTTRLAALLILPLALSACTNSKFIVGPLYNRLDDQIRGEFHKLGDFDDEQIAMFEAAVGTGHVWHRQVEMPAYARLIGEISRSISRSGQTTEEDVTRWSAAIEGHTVAARECHPVNFSFELMKSLEDEEINFIERRFARERTKNRERYYSRTPEERVERRLSNVQKWASRAGMDLTATQSAMLRTTFQRQISLRREYYLLSDRWNAKMFRLARDQEAADYDTRMSTHLGELWTLLEKAHPEEWAQNRELWRDFSLRFVNSMTDEQRRKSSQWLGKLSSTIDGISRDKPSFQAGNDPTVGCLVDEFG